MKSASHTPPRVTDAAKKRSLATLLRVVCSFSAGALLASAAHARPTATDGTGIVGTGKWEMENAVEYKEVSDESKLELETAFAYGLTSRAEAEIGWQYIIADADDEETVESLVTALETKIRFWESAPGGTALGFKGKIEFPSSVSGTLSSTDPKGYAKLLLSHPIGNARFDLNFGYKYRGTWERDDNDDYFVGFGQHFELSPRWELLSEVFAEIPTHDRSAAIGVVAAGFKCELRDNLEIDFLVGTGIGHDSPVVRATSGLTWVL